MTEGAANHASGLEGTDRHLPPVPALAVASMILVVAGGVYLAAHLPRPAPLGPAVGLVVSAGALVAAAVAMISRMRPFAWTVFARVAGWSFVAYVVIAGLLEYVFVLDGTRGSVLVVLTLMLVIFAVDIPLLFGFSVARYQEPDPGA
jgi:hypothetical protein